MPSSVRLRLKEANMPDQKPFPPVPRGGVPHDEPDGWTTAGGNNALRDLQPKTAHPPIESGDWQANYRPGVRPRGRP